MFYLASCCEQFVWICTRVVFINVVVVHILQKLAEWQGPLTPSAWEQIVEPPHLRGLEVLVSGHCGAFGIQLYLRKRGYSCCIGGKLRLRMVEGFF